MTYLRQHPYRNPFVMTYLVKNSQGVGGGGRGSKNDNVGKLALGPDDHLPDTVAILAGDSERLIDVFERPGVREQRRKPLGVGLEQLQSLLRLVIRSAHVEKGQLLAPHR